MAEPFLAEIRIMSFNFPPKGWALCNGQLLPINQNQPLFAMLGTTYGGNGQTTFALPNLRGRAPMHRGNGHTLGEQGGQEFHTLTQSEMPAHLHFLRAAPATATTNTPSSSTVLAASAGDAVYRAPKNLISMAANAVSSVGGSQPHENRQPLLVLNFCIALQGIFPS